MFENHVFTVSELTREIKSLLEKTCVSIWVEGEISNLKIHSSGHVYFVLKDESSQIKAVLFRSYYNGVKFDLQDGMKVVAFGDVSVYEKRGDYQFYVRQMEPKGIGALQLAFEQLKERLFNEGLFDERHKKPIPVYPESIGVVTSITGAAIRDILHVVNRRFSEVHMVVYPVKVQGEGAADEIAQAIHALNKSGDVEVIIVGRGGGSIEDLWAFNEEQVARAIFSSLIPVISAVGHEIDWTISDYVADVRVPTPSAAAELVISRKDDLIGQLAYYNERLLYILSKKLELLRFRFDSASERMLRQSPLKKVYDLQQFLDELSHKLHREVQLQMTSLKNELFRLTEKLEVLNPLKVLQRGYSITVSEKTKRVVTDAASVTVGENIRTRLYKGELFFTVQKIVKNK